MRRSLAVLLGILAAACGGNDFDTPVRAVETFMEACEDGDREAAMACLVARDQNRYAGHAEDVGSPHRSGAYTIGDAETEGDRAVVPVAFHGGEKPRTVRFLLEREEDGWRIRYADTMANAME